LKYIIAIINGHTPQELYEQFEKPKMRPLPEEPYKLGGADVPDIMNPEQYDR